MYELYLNQFLNLVLQTYLCSSFLFYVFLSDLSFKMHVYLYYTFIPMSFLHKPKFKNVCFVHQKITDAPFSYDNQKMAHFFNHYCILYEKKKENDRNSIDCYSKNLNLIIL